MEATASRARDRIQVRTRYPYKNLQNDVPGAYWSETRKCWSLPLTMEVCRNLREVFGSGLRVEKRLADWARLEIAREQRQSLLGRADYAVLSRVPRVAPKLDRAMKSRPYQTSAAKFVAANRWGLIADTPGLGKSTETIAAIVESGVEGPFLIIAPKTALPTWEREIRERIPELNPRVFVVDGTRRQRGEILDKALWCTDLGTFDGQAAHETLRIIEEALPRTWIIINIEMVRTKSFWECPKCGERWKASDRPKANIVDCGDDPRRVVTVNEHEYPELFGAREWGAIVADECQRSLLRTSGQPTQTRAGMKLLKTADDGLRIALSGTPMRGKPQRLFGTLNWLNEKRWSAYWPWLERFWRVTTTGYGGAREIGDFIEEREPSFNASLEGAMIRRTKAEVSPDLPPKLYQGQRLNPDDEDSPVAIWLEMTPEQEKAYKDMAAVGTSEVDGGDLNAIGVLAQLTRMKQFANTFMKVEQTTRPATKRELAKINEHRAGEGLEPIDSHTFYEIETSPQLPSNKLNWIEQWLLERNIIDGDDEPTGKVIIASQFTEMLELFANALAGKYKDFRYRMVTGNVTGGKRQEAIDTFNDMESGVNVMFLNTTAGGVAITLDAADDMIICDETHVPDDQEQLEDRNNNRRPEEKAVQRNYWYLKSLNTVDEAIAVENSRRDRQQKRHLDDRRGVPYLRAVLAQHREVSK